MEVGSLEVGSQRDWLGEYIWLFLVGPQLEAGAKFREAGCYWPSPDHLGPIAAEAVVWCPRLIATEVVSQSSVDRQDLVTAHLYIPSLSFLTSKMGVKISP